jgi:hypothetical protein
MDGDGQGRWLQRRSLQRLLRCHAGNPDDSCCRSQPVNLLLLDIGVRGMAAQTEADRLKKGAGAREARAKKHAPTSSTCRSDPERIDLRSKLLLGVANLRCLDHREEA